MKKTLYIFLIFISQMIFAQSSSDCGGNVQVCGNTPISFTPTGPGAVLETLGGCLGVEHFSIWYTFTIASSGTLTFNINPNNFTDDYDWAVYGPNVACGNLGGPIRCNYSAADGPTGLDMTSTATTQGAGGPPFCSYMDVVAGQTYYLLVDNFSSSANGFILSWGGTATLVSPFNSAFQPYPFMEPGTPGPTANSPREVIVCTDPAVFNFTSLTAGIVNNNPNFTVSYYYNSNDAITGNNPITAPITVNTTDIYYYAITYSVPGAPASAINRCRIPGNLKFIQRAITATDVTLTKCNNNNMGTAIFDLTTANVIADPTVTKKYYPTLADLNAGTNEITNPYQYVSAGGSVFVLVTSPFGCTDVAQITLSFFPVVVVTEATLRSCFIETNPATASFDLTLATVTTQPGTKTYFPSMTDAVNGTNAISNPNTYISPNGVVFIKVTDGNGCYGVAKVILIVLPPVYSNLLEDKIICMEDTTTLDAGPGFTAYKWSTGATTQTISNVTVGTYWVDLKTGNCTTRQNVKVYPSEQPVISSIDITNNTVTVNVVGGTAPYKYSVDGINWQDSNVFTNVPRGDNTVFVKDDYDCDPLTVTVVVPNLVNVITPNGDGVNDVIDYSALAGKQNLVLSIFDRYGVKVGQADKFSGFKWDGTTAGKKVPTGTYWYSVEWNENDKKNTPFKFSGWVMVKNRE
ncbi:gliding motility-associated-like protein [Chryseobacterium ginsenosidimutans]|uniref:T9SS type B sorting domain-containing protein n=1 Tax=Chryseobacterium ginsenosidimutans TaxID=687846 RepID=UPI002166F4A1|nr:T9SS type B sorting domain-containing protein [Chryseobacterium ginsenosidimutans]MCS3867813.1 gliding motility-associated-like protein [Chryseobacterium ginsenosidimutans]